MDAEKNYLTTTVLLSYTLRSSSDLSPYIFTPVQKVKIGHIKIDAFITKAILCRDSASKALAETLQVLSFKMTCTYCTDAIRVKVPSFQKVTLYSTI